MEIPFYKYQATGNDFVIVDNRDGKYDHLDRDTIARCCDRRFGIGADGLMMLNLKEGYDFEMRYFNADGRESSMCGNGGRCMVKFAYQMGIHRNNYRFLAADGEHEAEIHPDGNVSLKMKDVNEVRKTKGDYILDTGSPHFVRMVQDINALNVVEKGREVRNSKEFEKDGINVNFVERLEEMDHILVRTYERGVENETYSCGTGVTASALVSYHNEKGFNRVDVKTLGGHLGVEYERVDDNHYKNIWLNGPATEVYKGSITINGE